MLLVRSLSKGRKAAAFTLVELLVILVVMSVLAGSVVVNLQGADQVHALAAARQELSQAITFARTQSQAMQRTHRVMIAADGRSFLVEMKIEEAREDYVPAKGMAGMVRNLGKRVRITQVMSTDGEATAAQALIFTPDGSGFAGTVRLTTDSGRTAAMEVMPVTGQVTYLD